MIDVCFSTMAAELLKSYRKELGSEAVFHLGGNLHVGDLTEPVSEHFVKEEADTLRYYYEDISDEEIADICKAELRNIRTRHTKFRKYLDKGESVRVWISKCANDYCGFFWLCSEMKKLPNKLFVVVVPTYDYNPVNRRYLYNFGWGIDPDSVTDIVNAAEETNVGEKEFLAREWEMLVEKNKPVRFLINDMVMSAEADLFDSSILSFVTETPTAQKEVMSKFLGNFPCCTVAFVSARLERMLEKGLIAVSEAIVDEEGCYWPRKIVKQEK